VKPRIIRVFPRKTMATPTDALAVVSRAPEPSDEADEVHVSVTFEWDLQKAEVLAEQWKSVAPVKVGGPATGSPALDFTPGMYLKHGYTITSRGCPNKCARCLVPKREGPLRILEIKDGWDVLDNNLLACPTEHQEAVFEMLLKQGEPAKFTGGLEAARITPWHCEWLKRLKTDSIWTAFDHPGKMDGVYNAVELLKAAGIVAPHKRKRVGAYVLMGWHGDSPAEAEKRLRWVIGLGIRTQAMLLDNGREGTPEDMKSWWNLRKKFTNAAEVGAMVSATWDWKKRLFEEDA
jgi:hypothetical protein